MSSASCLPLKTPRGLGERLHHFVSSRVPDVECGAGLTGLLDIHSFLLFQLHNLEKAGILNKTKVSENGKKVR